MAATMDDVASLAGVSRALVSMVFSGSPQVSAQRREAVEEAAKSLGYRPNLHARRLASGRTGIIGVLLSDLRNSIFADILDGFADGRGEPETLLLATGFRQVSREKAAIEMFLAQGVDAVVLIGTELPNGTIRGLAEQMPTVVVGRSLADVDCVHVDDVLGGRIATEHLLDLGHRSILHITGGNGAGAKEREKAFRRCMRSAGLGDSATVVRGAYTEEAGREAALEALKSTGATAVFAANDIQAIGVLAAARTLGINVPQELSVIGYDNIELAHADFLGLSSVDYSRAELGRAAFHMVNELLASRGAQRAHETRSLVPTVVQRRTTSEAPLSQP